jgi:6-phosphofructokinase 1
MTIRRIGILTGGGDCPGLNAAIRGIGKAAIHGYGLSVLGIRDGFQGLIEDNIKPLDMGHLSGILCRGGTILGTNNKCDPRRYLDCHDGHGNPVFSNAVDRCVATIERHEIDALFIIGGDGTFECAQPLVEAGIPCIGVPKTIDNDITGTELTIGFTTASRVGTMALDRLHSTADSHHRVMVCELMGRNAGWLALSSGLASGSDVILIPEIPFDMDAICAFVQERRRGHSGFSIIACAEGARPIGGDQVVADVDQTNPHPIRLGGIGDRVAREIHKITSLDTRTTVLGHIQRGGEPASSDRVLATVMGTAAVELAMAGACNRLVTLENGAIGSADITVAASGQRLVPLDHRLIAAARAVRTCFGD